MDLDWIVLPFLLVGGYAATFFVVYFNVALAGAARLSMDGHDTTVAEGLAVARQRRGVIARWALVQFAVGVIINSLEAMAGDNPLARAVASLVSAVANVAWSVGTFFVIPLLALEGLGPRDALARSAKLIRERWGEGLVGTASIGLAVFLAGLLPVLMLFGAASSAMDSTPALGTALFFLARARVDRRRRPRLGAGRDLPGRALPAQHRGPVAGGFAEQDMVAAFRAGGRGAS